MRFRSSTAAVTSSARPILACPSMVLRSMMYRTPSGCWMVSSSSPSAVWSQGFFSRMPLSTSSNRRTLSGSPCISGLPSREKKLSVTNTLPVSVRSS